MHRCATQRPGQPAEEHPDAALRVLPCRGLELINVGLHTNFSLCTPRLKLLEGDDLGMFTGALLALFNGGLNRVRWGPYRSLVHRVSREYLPRESGYYSAKEFRPWLTERLSRLLSTS